MDPVGQVRKHVREDEVLLWHGVPDPEVWFTAEDARLIPFSILFCGIALFVECMSIISDVPVGDQLGGIPLAALGLYWAAGRFWYERYRKRRTAYAITIYRALIVGPRSCDELPLPGQPVEVRRSRDSRHASVTFTGARLSARRPAWEWGKPSGYVPGPNTGMDPVFPGVPRPFAFYDVAYPDAMLRALGQARGRRAQ
jgi:hypothetical protein